jgi:hypothetical protein
MTLLLSIAIACLVLAAIPVTVFAANFSAFIRLPKRTSADDPTLPPISVLVPARNEEASIASAMKSILASGGVDLELIVLDDHSTDQTATIVSEIAQTDHRVRLIAAPPLPAGWCGKQHACQILADQASHDALLWMDADVRLSPDALERMLLEFKRNPAALISGFPFEQTQTWLEALLIPLIHFILLGFLPLRMMRRDPSPSLGAGCGQLFMAERKQYIEAGGHAAIRASLHDGIALPRAFRKAGKRTDLFDASDLAQCRMYDSASAVWNGLLKNAGEGIATPVAIVPWTVMLLGGQTLPLLLIIYLAAHRTLETLPMLFFVLANAIGIIVRLISAHRFYSRSSGLPKYISAIAHPLGVSIFLLIQWHFLLRRATGRRAKWKGRAY